MRVLLLCWQERDLFVRRVFIPCCVKINNDLKTENRTDALHLPSCAILCPSAHLSKSNGFLFCYPTFCCCCFKVRACVFVCWYVCFFCIICSLSSIKIPNKKITITALLYIFNSTGISVWFVKENCCVYILTSGLFGILYSIIFIFTISTPDFASFFVCLWWFWQMWCTWFAFCSSPK